MFSCTGLSPSTATPSRGLPLTTRLSHSPHARQHVPDDPTTPPPQPLPGITWKRFSLIRFRSPLLTESRLFSLPVGTEMFHFPTFPPHALCVQARVTPHDWCGVPPFGHPRINARLAAPRGLSQPPTSFIGSWCPGIHRVPLTTWPHNYNKPHTPRVRACNQRRCSRPLCSSQRTTGHPPAPPPPTPPPAPRQPAAHRRAGGTRTRTAPTRDNQPPTARTRVHPARGSAPSGPNSVPTTPRTPPTPFPTPPPTTGRQAVLGAGSSRRPNWSAFHPRAPPHTHAATRQPGDHPGAGAALHHPPLRAGGELLLRKEVIQPHLPVRLPCYDFVPIADPAFDGSLPQRGWATGFGRYRLS